MPRLRETAPTLILRTTKNPRFVDEFLTAIPRRARRWSGTRWFVKRDCLPRLEAIYRRHFDHVEIREAA